MLAAEPVVPDSDQVLVQAPVRGGVGLGQGLGQAMVVAALDLGMASPVLGMGGGMGLADGDPDTSDSRPTGRGSTGRVLDMGTDSTDPVCAVGKDSGYMVGVDAPGVDKDSSAAAALGEAAAALESGSVWGAG